MNLDKLGIKKCNYCTVKDTQNKDWCSLKCPIKKMVKELKRDGMIDSDIESMFSLKFVDKLDEILVDS